MAANCWTGIDRAADQAVPPVVGIGASAGGIQALQTLFGALADNTGAAFVVVMHLDPSAHSDLSAILASATRMPVLQVTGSAPLKADHVYVISPDRRLFITDHEISSAAFDEPRGQRAPIDLFFRSLAGKGDGYAVVLTGAGSDGAIGVRAVKEKGGIILVQDPNEAEYASMPRSAIATGVADFILPVRDIAARLADLVELRKSVPETPPLDEETIRRILAHLRVRTGHDFSRYKRSTVLRRIARRMQVTRTEDLSGYYEFLRDHADEAQSLLGDLLISVTMFFRDQETFEALKKEVIPQLIASKEAGETVRVWVPGCATGEETYSIAMLLLEEVGRHEVHPTIQVFGSDLDARALAIAREGRYPAAIEADVSEDRLRRYFHREGERFRVRQDLRDVVIFAAHDLLKDPPFSRIDLISCRNVLIYLDRELQEQVCSTFHYALNPGGFLLLGSAETADNPPGFFLPIDRAARIYQTTARVGERPRLLPRLLGSLRIMHEAPGQLGRAIVPASAVVEAAAHRRALERNAPPSILVDPSHRVLHLSETAGRYISPSGGPLSGDIVDLVRAELRFELRSALDRVFERRNSTLSLPIPVRFNGAPHRVQLLVKPVIEDGAADAEKALVIFLEGGAVEEAAAESQKSPDDVVLRLTQELELTQARLRTVREESETANEELRAANEELQSINEEYRSTSEELETSKEELQSINEELQTVNNELKLKLETISRANSDLRNLMAATDFGTLFLDTALRIKRFTDHVTALFSITGNDEGRPITDFAHRLEYDSLVADAQSVLAELAPVRREVRTREDHRWYDVRLRPYRTVDNKIDGVVITFVDVTERRQVEEALRNSEAALQQQTRLVELSREPIYVWEFDGGIVGWNRGCEELYGYSRQEAVGRSHESLLTTTVPGSTFDALRTRLRDEGSWSGELRQKTKDGRDLIVESRMQLEAFEGGRRLVLESNRDVTEQRGWEARQRLLLSELTHRVKNTLTVVQAIARQTLRGTPSPEEFTERFEGRLEALSQAHNMLMRSNWRGADLAGLARSQLEPYGVDGEGRVRIAGSAVLLPADLATTFSLILHELATNAAKHGSLALAGGRVDISWNVEQDGDARTLRFEWREHGGPRPPSEPLRTGFGTALIDNALSGGTVTREFSPDGLVLRISSALPRIVDGGAFA